MNTENNATNNATDNESICEMIDFKFVCGRLFGRMGILLLWAVNIGWAIVMMPIIVLAGIIICLLTKMTLGQYARVSAASIGVGNDFFVDWLAHGKVTSAAEKYWQCGLDIATYIEKIVF